MKRRKRHGWGLEYKCVRTKKWGENKGSKNQGGDYMKVET